MRQLHYSKPATLILGAAAAILIGAVDHAPAEEAAHQVLTAISTTTISGYVSTSAIWAFGNQNPIGGSFTSVHLDTWNTQLVRLGSNAEVVSGFRNALFIQQIDAGDQLGSSSAGVAMESAFLTGFSGASREWGAYARLDEMRLARLNLQAFTPVTAVPEPSTLGLFACGALGLIFLNRRR